MTTRSLLALAGIGVAGLATAQTTITFRNGQNGYTGTQDTRLRENFPDDASLGNSSSLIFVDGADASNPNHYGLWRFDDIIGSGKIPAGARILQATLKLYTPGDQNGPGHGGMFYRILVDWNEATATYNNMGAGFVPGTNIATNPTAQAGAFSIGGGTSISAGYQNIDVTPDVQAFVDGTAPNYGWLAYPFVGGSNGWGTYPSEATDSVLDITALRPALVVTYTTDPANYDLVKSFRQDVEGYSGQSDTFIIENAPDVDYSYDDRFLIDYTNAVTPPTLPNTTIGLLKFAGLDSPDTVGKTVVRAVLSLEAYGPSAPGHGAVLYRLRSDWTEGGTTWAGSFGGDGIQTDGTDTVAASNAKFYGVSSQFTNQWGNVQVDVTADVKAWMAGEPNYGWALMPHVGGTDGWFGVSKDTSSDNLLLRPKLTIYYSSNSSLPGDIDADGDVDIDDYDLLANAYGSFTGDPTYSPAADLDGDGDVDIDDYDILAANYGRMSS